MRSRKPSRGFTLIELMVVVAVIGILSSVAIPELKKASLRARTSERRAIMRSIALVVNDLVAARAAIPGHVLAGDINPPLPLSTQKRKFDPRMAGWDQLALQIDGNTYYAYAFVANDHFGATPAEFPSVDVTAYGDLDGDGSASTKILSYTGLGYEFQLASETPAAGMEDLTTF